LITSEAIKTEQAIDLANYLCMHYWWRGKFRVAEKHGRKAAAISERHFEPGHPRIATSQSNLGEVLRNLGELKEARDLLRKALESDEKSFEPGHPIIALRQSVLALVLQNLGELKEARDLAGRACRSFRVKFGPGHPYTKTAKRNWESF
jgi:tetratricopeptide (TPR) repeat protein